MTSERSTSQASIPRRPRSSAPSLAETSELAWLAGLLEGEGSFAVIRNHVRGRTYEYPQIVVTMTDQDVIERVAHLFGNSVYHLGVPKSHDNRARLPQYRAQVSGASAAAWMRRLLPLMGARRGRRIQEVLDSYGEQIPGEVRRILACKRSALRRYGHPEEEIERRVAEETPQIISAFSRGL